MAAFAGKTLIANGGANDRAILNAFYAFPNTFGNIRHVYSGALGTASGITPTDAFLTLAAAQTAAVADNEDIVYVLPGHAEAISGAAGITFSKAGVTYQGIGRGAGRPTITWGTAVGAQVLVTGARITFRNILFDFTGFDNITAGILISSADVTFEDCEFTTNSGTKGVAVGILTAATADRLTIRRCRLDRKSTRLNSSHRL